MIERKLLPELINHLKCREISLITGPRQCGKTTLMGMLREHLSKAGEKSIYLNLDVEWDRAHLESQHALVRKIELELGKNRGYVFIDEIQQKENAGIFLKGLFDLNLPHKFIVTGSGSLELKEKIHESLAGRKRLFELTTLSFEEFCNYRTEYRYRDRLRDFFETEPGRTSALAQEYMSYGGYPRVVLESGRLEKRSIINDIYRSVVEKDVAYLLKVDKPDAFTVPLGEWEKSPRLQAKTLVCLRYGALPQIKPYSIRYQISHCVGNQIPQAGIAS